MTRLEKVLKNIVMPDLIRHREKMTEKNYYTYILASQKNGTLYIGVTFDIYKRVLEHKQKKIEGFTKKYNLDKLVYYEIYNDVYDALNREKTLKKWKREWKIKIIEEFNPGWEDLSLKMYD